MQRVRMAVLKSEKIPSTSNSHATKFAHAVTLSPALSAVNGLRSEDRGAVDIDVMIKQHREYIDALKYAGADVTELKALAEFPDAQFVEDTALCLPGMAVMMRPGAASRKGEVAPMRDVLSGIFDIIEDITEGSIEAGDILTTPTEILVGLSSRTNVEGAEQLQNILQHHGFSVRVFNTPPEVLHFKTDCSLIDDHCLLSTKRLASSGCFKDYAVLLVPEGEEEAANMIRYNDHIIMAEGFYKTENMLKEKGFNVLTVANSECAKIDGGMSCLSLRF